MSSREFDICKVVRTALGLLFIVVIAAAIMGVFLTHMSREGPVFGTQEGALSVLALVVATMTLVMQCDYPSPTSPHIEQAIIAIILIAASILSAIDLFAAHIHGGSIWFGTLECSFAILAFSITSKYWVKQLHRMCTGCKFPTA